MLREVKASDRPVMTAPPRQTSEAAKAPRVYGMEWFAGGVRSYGRPLRPYYAHYYRHHYHYHHHHYPHYPQVLVVSVFR